MLLVRKKCVWWTQCTRRCVLVVGTTFIIHCCVKFGVWRATKSDEIGVHGGVNCRDLVVSLEGSL